MSNAGPSGALAEVVPIPTSRLSDETALLIAHRHGDVRAFELLFDRCQARLRALSMRYLADVTAADDVIQEAFLRLLRIADQVDGGFNVMAWLHRVAINLCLTELRQRGRVQLISGDEAWVVGARDPRRDRRPDQAYEAAQARDQLGRVAATLPTQQRAAFLMREVEGLSYQEIARRLGIGHGAVESQLFRARRRFRREYLRLEGEQPTVCATTRHLVEVVGRAQLGPWQRRQVTRHLEGCEACRRRFGEVTMGGRTARQPASCTRSSR